MKRNIFCTGLILLALTGCVTVNTLPSPSPSTSSTPTPVVSPTPIIDPTPSSSPLPTSTPSPSPTDAQFKGALQGRLTIGPLCPVEPCNVTDEQKRQAYNSRKIQIYNQAKTILIAETYADYKTEMYRVELAVGTYVINVTNGGLGNFQPREFTIQSGQTTTMDLDVDTGIR